MRPEILFIVATRRVAPTMRRQGGCFLSDRLRAMKIRIEFIGFPIIYDLFPEGQHSYSFPGGALPGLIEDLAAHEDPRVKDSLLDPGTRSLDPTIQIMLNQKLVPKEKIQEQEVGEGDHITFLKLLAGG